jgi:cytoskeletal protein CcmA (bactofilin family)
MALKGDTPNSVIGENSVFIGKFHVSGSMLINGKFEGDIKTEDQIIIGETGKVKTEVIVARRVVVAGTLIGNIQASEEVELLETGRVLGDIETPILKLNKGVVVEGRINITGGQKKEAKKIVEESYSTGPIMPSLSSIKGGQKLKQAEKESKK